MESPGAIVSGSIFAVQRFGWKEMRRHMVFVLVLGNFTTDTFNFCFHFLPPINFFLDSGAHIRCSAVFDDGRHGFFLVR